jgi:8-oxo-dGTP diphosphatase
MGFSLTVDIVVIALEENGKFILLIKRGNEPYKDKWALPGGFVKENEEILDAALRELQEETKLKYTKDLWEIGFFSKVGRDPRGRVCSVAFLAIINNRADVYADTDAIEAKWFKIDDLPDLAFDHADIIKCAIDKLGFIITTKQVF